MTTKSCSTCHSELPATTEHFHRNACGKHGLGSRCKPCDREYQRDYQRTYHTSTPEREAKYRARVAVRHAARDGRLIPQPCEVCGDPEADGHHEDYSKPLEVRWLCEHCHYEEHRGAA